MTTFKTFLLEKMDEKEQVFSAFSKFLGDCRPYLEKNRATLKIGKFFLRGMDPIETDMGIDKLAVRQDRRPRDTDIDVHNKVGDWFKRKFGINYRVPVVFCFQVNKSEMSEYGEAHIILPCGQSKYCFSPMVDDLTVLVDPHTTSDAGMHISQFIYKNKRRYLKRNTAGNPNVGVDSVDYLTYFFLMFYWLQSPETFKTELTETTTLKQFNNFFTSHKSFVDVAHINDLMFHLEQLMKISKSQEPFMHFFLAYFGFDSLEHFKETLVQIGEDYLNSLKYRETEDQTTVKPLKSEVMVYCKSYVAVPLKYKKLLIEYINENF